MVVIWYISTQMTHSGIPGVTEEAPRYIQKVLLPDRSDAEAVADYTRSELETFIIYSSAFTLVVLFY